jgi:hypothetical protein
VPQLYWQHFVFPPKTAVPYRFPAESRVMPATGSAPFCRLKLCDRSITIGRDGDRNSVLTVRCVTRNAFPPTETRCTSSDEGWWASPFSGLARNLAGPHF